MRQEENQMRVLSRKLGVECVSGRGARSAVPAAAEEESRGLGIHPGSADEATGDPYTSSCGESCRWWWA